MLFVYYVYEQQQRKLIKGIVHELKNLESVGIHIIKCWDELWWLIYKKIYSLFLSLLGVL